MNKIFLFVISGIFCSTCAMKDSRLFIIEKAVNMEQKPMSFFKIPDYFNQQKELECEWGYNIDSGQSGQLNENDNKLRISKDVLLCRWDGEREDLLWKRAYTPSRPGRVSLNFYEKYLLIKWADDPHIYEYIWPMYNDNFKEILLEDEKEKNKKRNRITSIMNGTGQKIIIEKIKEIIKLKKKKVGKKKTKTRTINKEIIVTVEILPGGASMPCDLYEDEKFVVTIPGYEKNIIVNPVEQSTYSLCVNHSVDSENKNIYSVFSCD